MKKILLFTSIVLLAFSVKVHSQPLINNVTITNPINCFGDIGEISVNITQTNPVTSGLEVLVGSFPYPFLPTYFVSQGAFAVVGGNTNIAIPGLIAGDWTVRLVDVISYYAANPFGNGNDVTGLLDQYSTTITLDQPDALLATTVTIADNLCFGDCIAEEDLIITGGTKPYSFTGNASSPQTLAIGDSIYSFTALCADDYNITVTDANGCATLNPSPANITSFIITEPTEILSNGFVSSDYNGYNVSCNGGSDGQIIASTINNYTIQTVGNSFSPSNININIGDTVTFINTGGNHNINGTMTTFPSNPASFSNPGGVGPGWTFTHVFTVAGTYNYQCDPHAGGGMTGTIIVASSGSGTGAIQYSLNGIDFFSDPAGTQSLYLFTGLAGGGHTVYYKDSNNCVVTQGLTISEPPALSGNLSITQVVSCFGVCDGEIRFTVDGTQVGVPSYQYSIDNGGIFQGSTDFLALCGDSVYDVIIKDANNCTYQSSILLSAPNALSFSLTISDFNGVEISCDGASDGGITINNLTGGIPPYEYSSDGGGSYGASNSFHSLPEDQYTISIRDSAGCTLDTIIEMNAPAAFTMLPTITSLIDCPGNCNGEISSNPTAGVGQIVYSLNQGAQQTSPVFSGLCDASYTIAAVDDNGCVDTAIVLVQEPQPFIYSLSSAGDYCSLANGQASISVTSGGTGGYSYEWNTFPMQTTANTTPVLSAATYQVTVTDGNQCSFSELVTVASTPGFTVSFTTVEPCLGDSSGSATVSATGSAPYIYQWSDINGIIVGETSSTIQNMPIGTYEVVVTDATLCSITGSIDIVAPVNPIVVDSIVITEISCFGFNDAQIEVIASGGQLPYFYSIENGLNLTSDPIFPNLMPDDYIIRVLDGNNCFDDTLITVSSPDLLEIDSTVFTHISCFGAEDGAVQDIQFVGGTGPFEFTIDGGTPQTYMQFSDLGAGQHTVEVFDVNNCSTGDLIIINEPTLFEVDIAVSNWNNYQIMCNDDSSGYIDITASGGITPYLTLTDSMTFSSTNTINGLWAGNHTFIIQDNNGCEYTETIMFNEPSPIMHEFIETHVTCDEWNNGAVTDSVYGGVGSATTYSYLWGSGETTYSLDSLPVGVYTITVTDENGCEVTDSVEINNDAALDAASLSVSNVSCFGYHDGELSVTVSGGVPFTGANAYSYLWNDSDTFPQSTETASALFVDSISLLSVVYYCAVADALGCVDTVYFTLTQPEKLEVLVDTLWLLPNQEISCVGANDGVLQADVTGGTSPYTYLWGGTGVEGETTPIISNLGPATYVVYIEDFNGCRDTFHVDLTDADSLVIGIEEDDIACFGANNGYIKALASGGAHFEAEYLYTLYLDGVFEESITWMAGNLAQDSLEFSSLSPGNYYVVAEDLNGCEVTSLSVEITEPFAALTLEVESEDETGCLNDGVIRMFAQGENQSYYYFIDDVEVESNIITTISSGWHYIRVEDTEGPCEITDSIFIKDYTTIFLPDTVSTIDTIICLGQSITINVDERPGLIYTWSDGVSGADRIGDNAINPPEGVFYFGTDYDSTYTLTIFDPENPDCDQENTVTVHFNTIDPMIESNPEADYGNWPVVLGGGNIELSSENNDGVEYTWMWSNDTINNSEEITVSNLSSSDWYYLHIKDANDCLGYDSIYVVVGVYPYEAITPNNDGFNDTWTPLDIRSYQSALVQVFNRWGGLVFDSQGGEGYKPWDGTNNGKELPVGTYYYIIDLNTGDDPQTGPITLIR